LLNPSENITADSVNDLELLHAIKLDMEGLASISFSKNSSLLAIAPREGKIRLWNVSTLEEMDTTVVVEHGAQLFSQTANQILAAKEDDDTIALWDLTTGKLLFSFEGWFFPDGPAVSADGNLIALSSIGWPLYRNIIVWDLSSQKVIRTIYGDWATGDAHGYPVPYTVFFSPDGSLLVADLPLYKTIVWETDTWERIAEFDNMSALAFTPDGKTFVADGEDFDLAFFNSSTWEKIKIIRDVPARIQTAKFSNDGKLLIAAAREGEIIIWNWETGTQIQTLPTTRRFPIVISPDGALLVTYNESENEIYLWGIP
jgi:WD40 repeat protein